MNQKVYVFPFPQLVSLYNYYLLYKWCSAKQFDVIESVKAVSSFQVRPSSPEKCDVLDKNLRFHGRFCFDTVY